MGSTLDFLGATIADALSPKFRRPVEDIIYETIDRKQIPTRTDFTELRNTLNSLRSQSTGAQKGIEKIKTGLDDIEESIHDLTTRLSDVEGLIQTLRSENAALKEQLTNTNSPSSTQQVQPNPDQALQEQLQQLLTRVQALENTPTTSQNTKTSESSSVCREDSCTKTVRAGGFCSSHYNKWRRGTLSGFVSYDSTVSVDDQTITVDESLKGLFYTVNDGKLFVDGQEIALD
jgi:hypothetical protein